MIWPTDALLLAGTKLKTRKIRLGVTVFISALLFAGLVFMALVTTGAINSLKSFGKEGYGGRFIIQASPLSYTAYGDDALKSEFTEKTKTLVNQKKQLAKKLDLAYDEKSDQDLPVITYPTGPGGTTGTELNFSSPLVNAALAAKNKTLPGVSFDEFQKKATASGAINTYRSASQQDMMGGSNGSTYSVLINGKEDYHTTNDAGAPWESPKGASTISTLGWQTISPELLLPFTLPGQSVALGKDGSVPVVAPFSAAEEILGLKSLPATATSAQKLERLVQVRQKVAGQTAQICYRNGVSAGLVSQAVQQQQDIAAHKNDKDYTPPALQYNIPSTPCGPVTIKSDKRTDNEKKQANNQKVFDQTFGKEVEPSQGLLTIRIVGINQDVNYQPGFSATAIITSLFSSTLGNGWFSPNIAMDQNDIAKKIQGGISTELPLGRQQYYAEFNSLGTAENFMKSISCENSDSSNIAGSPMPYNPNTSIQNCIKTGMMYGTVPYGNSAGAIEQFRKGVWKVARFVILAVIIIAALVMMGNVGKIIADSRRETSVFRALGAKRLDISQIYLTYTLLLCALVMTVALAIGFLGASYLSNRYSPDISVNAVLAYNAQDVHKQFTLFGFDPLYIGSIALLVLLAGLLSTIIPLLTNMRRNPIRDMRDDS